MALGQRGTARWFLGDLRGGMAYLTRAAQTIDRLLANDPTIVDRVESPVVGSFVPNVTS